MFIVSQLSHETYTLSVGKHRLEKVLEECETGEVYTIYRGKMSFSLFVTLVVLYFEQITCLDISSGGGLGVSSSADGTMKIWQASNGELRVKALDILLESCT